VVRGASDYRTKVNCDIVAHDIIISIDEAAKLHEYAVRRHKRYQSSILWQDGRTMLGAGDAHMRQASTGTFSTDLC
jgi:hypothetical protein